MIYGNAQNNVDNKDKTKLILFHSDTSLLQTENFLT